MKLTNRPLYLVTDHTELSDEQFFNAIEQGCQNGVGLVQLRQKEGTSREIFELAQQVKTITDKYRVPLLIDDRLDIAQAVDAAGVHLGQSDLPVDVARNILGPRKFIGATAKTLKQAKAAEEMGADYLGVGAIFPTTTHVKTVHTSVETLGKIKQAVGIPVYAIGGLKADNVDAIDGAHVDGVAVVSAIMKAEDPAKAAQELRNAVEEAIG
ncbi:Thiamine-phosphate synthase [Lentilactobacillus parabuchneri]|uniref:Thiamine-phosphate synthase n=2 Tax=Lentilactobacillus parabuchneri TaxID=152331 RepID=A0A1X1FFJ8_9LACO|nr:thiamine phosphate synthase [Lentilactobacillus parabuchneri]APR07418.1 Thiamine-phosphate synthase [Lentilactobacillus parabuchneri]KRM44734.1 thiamine-phosphate pyrophosphorylase [Lentilactobacillus parabuchneri DSM 5707 = NBRC 107865]KRN77204.1 thiamine-phosphate pyrophosphorylase [Lentilactobacillus parabuchneri]MBW0223737.1 thiamine phosphate synthase [Lentilactobacillus parabuchneri]MCT2885102.1 thiamine phosphate synthase [Lentilactobacillus parabuchneri]